MDIHLPEGLLSGRANALKSPTKTMYVLSAGTRVRVVERWNGGFSTQKLGRPLTRGFVDLYDGTSHVSHGLAYLSSVDADTRIYAFKTATNPAFAQPADHVRLAPVPAGLLPRT